MATNDGNENISMQRKVKGKKIQIFVNNSF